MKKRLYLKFIIAYLCFGILSFVAVSIVTASLIQNHLVKSKTEAMYKAANMVAAGSLVQSYKEETSLQDIYSSLSSLAAYQSTEIWLMNTQGDILLDTSREYDPDTTETIEEFDPTQLAGSYYQQGDFFGHFSDDVLSVVAPLPPTTGPRAILPCTTASVSWIQKKTAF